MGRKLIKTYPQLAELCNWDLKVAEIIAKIHPSWLGYAGVCQYKHESDPRLEIRIPAPVADRELIIYTDGFHFTITFDNWHRHDYPTDSIEEAVQRLITTSHNIMDENWVIVMTSRLIERGRFRGEKQISFGIRKLDSLKQIPASDLVCTCSWNGTYDHIYQEDELLMLRKKYNLR